MIKIIDRCHVKDAVLIMFTALMFLPSRNHDAPATRIHRIRSNSPNSRRLFYDTDEDPASRPRHRTREYRIPPLASLLLANRPTVFSVWVPLDNIFPVVPGDISPRSSGHRRYGTSHVLAEHQTQEHRLPSPPGFDPHKG